ncbi:MAG TPA: permease prefix domain 1-containing protein, partial [Longimicrobiales bacterium]|nr:permease prefix domain 1-containing protein [Longimicrobiales bacterium]
MSADHAARLEEQIGQWREYLRRRRAFHAVDVAELEDHLREQVSALTDAGLDLDEAFLVAVKRMGALDAISREFAREHSERLWKQLVVVPDDAGEPRAQARTDAFVAFWLAVAAAVAIKVPALFGVDLGRDAGFYFRNASFFVLPLLTGYFVWKRRLDRRTLSWLAASFVVAAVFANVYPFAAHVPGSATHDPGNTELLTGLHLPIALWLVVGIAYAGGRWREVAGRMDFIRFSGELLIYYALIALGGGV